ncbi:14808_t:CDS:2 [Entrophospora sp. SA101]|nr:14808_t:CDS:2 [Entrophospora sp. SA101]
MEMRIQQKYLPGHYMAFKIKITRVIECEENTWIKAIDDGKEDISKPRENDDEEPPKVDRETFCKAHKIF